MHKVVETLTRAVNRSSQVGLNAAINVHVLKSTEESERGSWCGRTPDCLDKETNDNQV